MFLAVRASPNIAGSLDGLHGGGVTGNVYMDSKHYVYAIFMFSIK